MPFIPHTEKDIKAMLETISVGEVSALFDEIPASLPKADFSALPSGMNEMQLRGYFDDVMANNQTMVNYIGAGAYEHYIPACVWELTGRGEFMTAYTPYQAEASQGGLQLIYEFQTMMTHLTGMDVSNASMYDGATSVAEAILMAVRSNRKVKSNRVLLPKTLHPHYRQTIKTIVGQQGIVCVEADYDRKEGRLTETCLNEYQKDDLVAVVAPYPNFFGVIEEVDAITNWAHEKQALVIAVANPTALGLLKAPGQWGEHGADIVCGELQPLGIPLMFGGPYAGFLCCKQALVRQMPGRIVGRTQDEKGREGFVLTLQAREQHIRRAKATSNICTNQGLMVTAATIYLSVMGAEGLRRVALRSHQNMETLKAALCDTAEVSAMFQAPMFHEGVLHIKGGAKRFLEILAEAGIQGGLLLEAEYPELKDCVLMCATETKTAEQLEQCVKAVVSSHGVAIG